MSKYSSDSDSGRGNSHSQRSKMRGRSRSSSGSSSDSHYSYKRKSYKHKRSKGHRSRSRDRRGRSCSRHHTKTSDSSHSLRSRSRSKGHSRKSSRDRSQSGETQSRDRSRRRSVSRSRYRSQSGSKERSRYRSRSHSPGRRTSGSPGSVKQEASTEEQLQAKLQRAIKAAQSADDQLRQQGLLTGGSSRKEDLHQDSITPVYQASVLDEINDPSFVPKHFSSSKSIVSQVPETSVIDLTTDAVPSGVQATEDPESIFHTSLTQDPKMKLDRWVKKLFHMRQKAINGEPLA